MADITSSNLEINGLIATIGDGNSPDLPRQIINAIRNDFTNTVVPMLSMSLRALMEAKPLAADAGGQTSGPAEG